MQLAKVTKEKPLGARGMVAKVALPFFCGIFKGLQVITNEKYVIKGKDNIKELEGPALYLPTHVSWADIYNLGALWWHIGRPDINGLGRTGYLKNRIIGAPLEGLMARSFFVLTTRESEKKPGDHSRKVNNAKKLNQLISLYERGISVCIAAEGTSKSNGRILNPRGGAYHASQFDGKFVPCVPIGNTIDTISGHGPRTFINIGQPFYKENFGREDFDCRLYEAWTKLNTFTMAQLASTYIVKSAAGGRKTIEVEGLDEMFAEQADELVARGFYVDDSLFEDKERRELWEGFLDYVCTKGYVSPKGTLNTEKIGETPTVKDWKDKKRGNLLRYHANRVASVLEVNSELIDLLAA